MPQLELTPQEEQALQEAQELRKKKEQIVEAFSEKARRHLLDFCSFSYSGYARPRHIQYVADVLERVERGEIKRLMLFMPPRHGKSELSSRRFPAWALGRNPNRRIILTSYGSGLANELSRSVRDIVEDVRYPCVFPGVATKGDSRSVESWDLAGARGGVFAAGVGGAMTGYGADILIIDDPVKNQEEAESDTQRERVWDWYRSVARTRLEKDAAIILIMTRWHQEDLAGKILAESGEEWTVVNLPAVYREAECMKDGQPIPDPLGRKDGEALWAGKYDETALAGLERDSGSRVWSALFQGQPKDPKSKIIQRDWIQYFDNLPAKIEAIGGGMDTATSKKTKSDKTSIVEVVRAKRDNQTFYFVDRVFCEQVSVTGGADQVLNTHAARHMGKMHLESNNAGEAFRQRIVERAREKDIVCPKIECIPTSSDKVVRVMEFQAMIENGTLLFRRNDAKVAELIQHLIDFTGAAGEKDDDIDALGFAIKAAQASKGGFIMTSSHSTDPE